VICILGKATNAPESIPNAGKAKVPAANAPKIPDKTTTVKPAASKVVKQPAGKIPINTKPPSNKIFLNILRREKIEFLTQNKMGRFFLKIKVFWLLHLKNVKFF